MTQTRKRGGAAGPALASVRACIAIGHVVAPLPLLLLLLLCVAGADALGSTWGVPTPPVPSYPCRTVLPDMTGFREVWVNPKAKRGLTGDGSQAAPFRTFAAAWESIPKFGPLAQGVRVRVLPGVAGSGANTYWMEGGWGTAAAPIVVTGEAAAGKKQPNLQGINVSNCSYLYFKDVTFKQPAGAGGGGDVVHFAGCDYIHLLNVRIYGNKRRRPQETIKVNQATGMYIEDSLITVAEDNALDWVAVQYGHLCRTTMADSNWGAYVKGGSAYVLIDSNTVTGSGESALRVGQGTGFEYMTPPWINYEAYAVRVTNNVVMGAVGAGLGVAGGYDVLVAYNSVYKAGARSHMAEFLFGSRSCDGDGALPGRCDANQAAGGWGPATGGAAVPVPNVNVFFMNNLLVNPAKKPTAYTHFDAPSGPTDESPGPPPTPTASAVEGLRVAGNVVVNGGPGFAVGLDACADANPTCNAAQLAAQNAFNPAGAPPALVKFLKTPRLLELSAAARAAVLAAWPRDVESPPDFPAPWATPLATPAPPLGNAVPFDGKGVARTAANNMPGAFV